MRSLILYSLLFLFPLTGFSQTIFDEEETIEEEVTVSKKVPIVPEEAMEEHVTWMTNFEAAKTIAKREKKKVLIYFTGSDWCAPCKMLDKDFFKTSAFEKQSEDYVLVKVDLPRRDDIITPTQKETNKKILTRFKVNAFPTLMIIHPNEKIIDQISGYGPLRDPSRHFDFIKR